jgi:hypothetical protein
LELKGWLQKGGAGTMKPMIDSINGELKELEKIEGRAIGEVKYVLQQRITLLEAEKNKLEALNSKL